MKTRQEKHICCDHIKQKASKSDADKNLVNADYLPNFIFDKIISQPYTMIREEKNISRIDHRTS